jgi:integrase/recombinase XerC
MSYQASFIQHLTVSRSASAHTLRAYASDLASLDAFVMAQEMASIFDPEGAKAVDHRLLRLWMGDLLARDLSPKTVSRKLSAARTYFRYLYRQGLLPANPAGRMHLPKPQRDLPVFLKEADIRDLLDGLAQPDTFEAERDRCLLEILYGCGLRRSELVDLQRSDLSFVPPTLRVRGKGKRERMLPFGPHLQRVIEQYLARAKSEGISTQAALLVRPDGQPLYGELVYRVVQRELASISALQRRSPHVLRHTYATHLLERGADLNAIKELLGHQSLAATQVYTHNSISQLKAVHQQAHPRAETIHDNDS